MTAERFIALRSAALSRMVASYAIGFFCVVADGFLVAFVPVRTWQMQGLIASLILSVAVFVILSISSVLSELEALRKDAPADLGGAFRGYVDQVPLGAFKGLTAVLHLLMAAAALLALFA